MYLLAYIIDKPGIDFHKDVMNNLSGVAFDHLKKFEDIFLEEGFMETNLFSISVSIELCDQLTLIKTNFKFSRFILDDEIKRRIIIFEKDLDQMLKYSSSIYRIDEYLIEKYWVEIGNELWFEEKHAFSKFTSWISSQESFNWEKLR